MELHSYDPYKGYSLFIEDTRSEEYPYYEGVVQWNGTTIFSCKGLTPQRCTLLLESFVDKMEDE